MAIRIGLSDKDIGTIFKQVIETAEIKKNQGNDLERLFADINKLENKNGIQ